MGDTSYLYPLAIVVLSLAYVHCDTPSPTLCTLLLLSLHWYLAYRLVLILLSAYTLHSLR